MRDTDNRNKKNKRSKGRFRQQWIRTDVKPERKHVMLGENNPVWNILIMLLILYLTFRFIQITASAALADGFLPGGAWELDLGKEIEAEDYEYFTDDEYNKTATVESDDAFSAEGQGPEEDSFDRLYDPREAGLVTEIKDQGRTALCWDFAANSTAESVLIKTAGYDCTLNLSEYQTAAYAYKSLKEDGSLPEGMSFYKFCNDGGRPSYVWNQWMKGYGPAEEDEYPTMSSVSENCVIAENMEAGHIRTLASVKAVEDDREAVKTEIMGKGAVFALYYSYPLYYNDFVNEQGDSSYYMPYSVESKNHAISIVGWDDDFPAQTFAKDFVRDNKDGEIVDEPLPNGAWLIKNSWGKRAYKTPDEASGYYWISYYDKSLSNFIAISFENPDSVDANDGRDDSQEAKDNASKEESVPNDEPPDEKPEKKETAEIVNTVDPVTPIPIKRIQDQEQGCTENESRLYNSCRKCTGGLKVPKIVKKKEISKSKKTKTKTVKKKGIIYTIQGKTATVKKCVSKKRTVKIPTYIKYMGKKYPVTKIGKNAFRSNRFVRYLVIR